MLNYQRVLVDMTCAVVVGTILCRFERSNRSWWDLAPLQPFSHRLKNCKKGASRLRAHAWFVPVSPVLHDWLEVTPANMGGQPAQILYIYVQYVWNQHYSTTSGSKKTNRRKTNDCKQAQEMYCEHRICGMCFGFSTKPIRFVPNLPLGSVKVTRNALGAFGASEVAASPQSSRVRCCPPPWRRRWSSAELCGSKAAAGLWSCSRYGQ